MSGGEATKLSDLTTAVRSFKWADDSARIFFLTEEPQTDAQKEARKNGDDAIFVDEGANGQSRGNFSNAWVITIADKQTRQLTTGDQTVTDFAPSHDGKSLAYIARPNNRRNFQNLSEVYVLDLLSNKTVKLTQNEAPEMRVNWSPDGTVVSYLSREHVDLGARAGKAVRAAGHRRSRRSRCRRVFQATSVSTSGIRPVRRIVMSTTIRGRRGVHELDVLSGQARMLVGGRHRPWPHLGVVDAVTGGRNTQHCRRIPRKSRCRSSGRPGGKRHQRQSLVQGSRHRRDARDRVEKQRRPRSRRAALAAPVL